MARTRGVSIARVWAWSAISLLAATLAVTVSMRLHIMRIIADVSADDTRCDELKLSIDNLMTAMLNQEVGLRGYLATADDSFLVPYETGRHDETRLRAAIDVAKLAREDRDELQNALALEEHAARRWHADIVEPQIEARRTYASVDVAAFLVDGKEQFDDYRAAHGTLRHAVERAGLAAERRHQGELTRANSWAGVVLALLVVLGVFGLRALVRRTIRPLAALSDAAERGEVSVDVVRESGLREVLVLAETLERLFRSVNDRAMRDGLTRVYNRGFLADWLPRQLRLSRRNGSPLSALMVDLDHFKRINDTYGHGAGDQVLVALARCIETQLRSTDVVVRYGGEEFTVLLPDTPVAGGFVTAERLRAAIAAMTEREGLPAGLRITASIGVAAIGSGDDGSQLITRADGALYQAKRGGRNRVVTAPPPSKKPAVALVRDEPARLAS
ncbi:MAG TPA: diguanylate cyclase [Polyangia bacterium]|jgi:diguanylate cyclase (GGDEF)-like protein